MEMNDMDRHVFLSHPVTVRGDGSSIWADRAGVSSAGRFAIVVANITYWDHSRVSGVHPIRLAGAWYLSHAGEAVLVPENHNGVLAASREIAD